MTLAKGVWQEHPMPAATLRVAIRKIRTQYIVTLLDHKIEAASTDFREAYENVVKQLNHEILRGTLPMFPRAEASLEAAFEKAHQAVIDVSGLVAPLRSYGLEARWVDHA